MSDPAARFARDAPGVESADPLQAGATRHVYAAELTDGPDEVRIVTASPDADPDTRAAVADRLDAWASLDAHPALGTVHARGEEPRPWLAVAAAGRPLPDVVPLSVEDTRSVVADVAEACRAGTNAGHPVPVAPADVRVVDETGSPASARLDWPVCVRDRLVPYAPLELADGRDTERSGADERAVVFRLGVLAYYAVTGQPPVEEGDEAALREGRWPSPSFVDSDVPRPFDAVVERALDPDPAKRFDSPYAFKRALLFESQPAPDPETSRQPGASGAVSPADDDGERETDSVTRRDGRDGIAGLDRRAVLGALGLGAVGVAGGAWVTATRLLGSGTDEFPTFRYDAANTGYAPDAVGPTDGVTEAWSVDLGPEVRSSPVVADGTVLVSDGDGVVHALDAADGTERWREPLDVPSYAAAAIDDGVAYVPDGSSQGGGITARALSDGSERWRIDEHDLQARIPVLGDGRLFAFGNELVQAVDVDQRRTLWTTASVSVTSLSGAVSGNTLYVGALADPDEGSDASFESRRRGVVALDVADGSEHWTFELGSFVSSSPAVVADTAYVGTDDDGVVAIDARQGEERWRFGTRGSVPASPAVTDHGGGTVYACCTDGYVYAIDRERHESRWEIDAGARIISSPAVVSDTVYLGTGDGDVLAVDAESGRQRWQFETGGPVVSSPAVVSSTVFVGSDDGHVYALTEP